MKFIEDKKGLILDIGANIGIMTYHLAKKFPSTKIHCFEPIPQNISVLKKIIAKFNLSNVILHTIALGQEKAKIKMILPEENKVLFQGLSHVKHESITEMNEGIEIDVDMDFLDNIFSEECIQAIKIDVENFEYFVLKGGEKMLAKNMPVIYAELWENENRQKCFDLIQDLNYKTFVVHGDELVSYDATVHIKQNFIFKRN